MNDQKIYHKNWFILLVIYLIAVLFRVICVYFLSWNLGPHYEYYEIAANIVEGKGYWWDWYRTIPPQPTALLPPIYIYFIVIFMKLFNDPIRIIYIAQSFINALGMIPCYYLGKHLGDRKAGFAAAGLFAVFPEMAVIPARLISETLFIPCVFLSLYLFLKYKSKLTTDGIYRQFFWLGIVLGITTLVKSTGSLITLGCFISLILIRNNRKAAYKAFLILGIGFFLATLPWNIRNVIVMKKPLLFTSNFGFNLWRGNHPWGSGMGHLDPKHLSEDKLSPEYREYLKENQPQTEIAADKFYLNEALRFIKQDPARYIRLTLKRMLYFITIDPTHPFTKNIYYIGGYIFVLFFGIWGAARLKGKGRLDSVFIIIPLLFFCFYTPIMIIPRFRMIITWILLILSSVSITHVLSRYKLFRRFESTDIC